MCETLPIDLDNCGKGGIQSAVGIIMVWARSKANVFVGMQMRRVVVALSAAVAVLLQLGHGWAFHIAVPMRMSAGRSVQVCTNTACKKVGARSSVWPGKSTTCVVPACWPVAVCAAVLIVLTVLLFDLWLSVFTVV